MRSVINLGHIIWAMRELIMEQIDITKEISARYTMETFKCASYECEITGEEIPTEEYVEWLERKVYELTCQQGGKDE